ncbi:lytic transglycosylase domain-containing protein [uncultured Litoreibacter sp.]|uniref:lytic transglycosylase domain-containing protein n=1 Tax=uncultured Litoreibacter sp. TaxID=1392394 RepID=UPI00261E24B1|nr:lytic transglycosylase domain-containing protein [uncultured Litoreibacter sp.]
MLRFVQILIVALVAALPLRAQDAGTLVDALSAGGQGDWARVDALRPRVTDRVARDLVDWVRLRGRQGSFGECIDFLERNDDWPGLKLLRLRCEYGIPRGSNPTQVISYFSNQLPQTGTGSLRFAEALIAKGRGVEAAAELKRAWLTFNLSGPEHAAFVERNGKTIEDLHEARMDMLLWRDSDLAIARMLPLVSDDWRKLAEARIGLRSRVPGVDDLIKAVPETLQDDPGLAFERFLWRARKGREDAVDIILERSISLEELGQPEVWAKRRRTLARDLLRDGKDAQAYAVASSHYLTDGSDFADLEWLSGFIALRRLDAPQQALDHFKRFERAVETPISLGRAGYWMGRAYEDAGDPDGARRAYGFGANYQSSFYGQLAAERAGLSAPETMTGKEEFPDWRGASFTASSVFKAAMMLQKAGLRDLSERFFVHLSEQRSRVEKGQLGDLALELGEPHIALMLAKQAAREGLEMFKTYFPVATPAGMDLPVAEEFALSIARRESEFDPVVISPVGARGLMQLMPGTAKEVAGQLGEEYALGRLRTDPEYNARLGSAYLAGLGGRYQDNPVLMSIGYNAGPSRAARWSDAYGDPRDPNIDIVDWIENLPFNETRNYVMRVTESFLPYRARLTGEVPAVTLTEDLRR